MCTKSKQKNNNQCIEDDEVLPLYGESDYSDYITDSEVENELFEMEQKEAIKQKKKIKANHDKKNNININSKSKSIFDDKSIDEIDISDSYEDILFDDNQENIDSYEDILYDDNQENNIKNGIILNKPLKSKNKSNILFSFSPINIPNKREGLSITEIDKIIKECIERYKMEWEEKKLYKLNEKIFFYYSKKNEYQGVENEYNDITYKRIPSLIETIKLHEYKSDKSLIRCCGILQESVYTQCRLKWLLELYKKPEEEFKNLKQLNNEKKVIEKAENKNEKNGGKKKTYIYEKEDWSDFIDDSEEFFDDSYQSNNDVVNEDSEFNNEANLLYNKDGNDIDNDSTLKLKNNLLRTNNIINKPINNNINYNKKKCLFQNNEINNDNEKNKDTNNNNEKNKDINNDDENNIPILSQNNDINSKNSIKNRIDQSLIKNNDDENDNSSNNKNYHNNQIQNNNILENTNLSSKIKTIKDDDVELDNLLDIYNNEILSIAENLDHLDINLLDEHMNEISSDSDNKESYKKNENSNTINDKNQNIYLNIDSHDFNNTTEINNSIISNNNNPKKNLITDDSKYNKEIPLKQIKKEKIIIIDSNSDDDDYDDNNAKAKESYQSDLRNINKSINEKGLHIPPPNFKIKSYNKEESMFERIRELSNLIPIMILSISQDPENEKHFPEELKIFYHNWLIYLSNKKENSNEHFSIFKITDELLRDFMKSSYFSIKYICIKEKDKISKRKSRYSNNTGLNKKIKLNEEESSESSDNNNENSLKSKSTTYKSIKYKYVRVVGDDEIEETILSEKIKFRKKNTDISLNSENQIINVGHPKNEPDIYIDSSFNCLKEHQIEGIRFLWKNVIDYKRGCIFAHAMGLGKTLQIISFLVTLKQTQLSKAIRIPKILTTGRIMIIVPASLLKNWEEEFIKWMPEHQPDILGNIYTIQGNGYI